MVKLKAKNYYYLNILVYRGIMKVVFLDIDGVLQPYDTQNNFYSIDKQNKKLVTDLSIKHNIDYAKYNIYDILMVYYDWHLKAIARLKSILDDTEAKIIISSDWKSEKLPDKMHDLLAIHDLDKYWYGDNIIIKKPLEAFEIRHLEIEDSLKRYPIDNYVILDDMEGLKQYFPNNSVITHDYISLLDMNDAVKILKKTR